MFRYTILFFMIIYFIIFISSCNRYSDTSYVTEKDRLNVIIDTDMGLDDIRALFALLADSTIDIQAILTIEGSAALGKGADNLIGLLESNHIESIPVFKGTSNPGLLAPTWRQMASGVAGVPFPPPQHIAQHPLTGEGFNQILHHGKDIEYLALGPLGNLAILLDDYTDNIKKINKIWIPVVIENNHMKDWNLLYDVESAQKVFSSDVKIVLVDIAAAGQLNTPMLLSSLEGNSRAVQWISQALANNNHLSEHGFFHDDMAAAVVIDRDLLTRDQQNFHVVLNEEKYFELIPDTTGNVNVVKLVDGNRAFTVLKTYWQAGPAPRYEEQHEPIVPLRDLLRTFHGHLGPYVVLGYRMGQLALKELHSDGHFGLSAEVHSILAPPHSCLIDGVQLGSGCTLGKRNIQIEEYGGPAWAVFISDQGKKVTIHLRPEIPGLVKRYVDEIGVEAAGEELLIMEESKVFVIE